MRLPGGQVRVVITDANKNAKPWQADVRAAALAAFRDEVLRGAVKLTLVFHLTRPKGHFGRRGLLPSAPRYPTKKPDALKLSRAVEDSLTGIIFHDDAQVVIESLSKVYADQDGCTVTVETLEDENLLLMPAPDRQKSKPVEENLFA